jgi:signal transduction histidine kinase/ligand-binding sensor domain-containing protein/DNA-binding response OmpR family regulator
VGGAIFICSCVRKDEKDIHSRQIPIKEAKGYVVPQDSMAAPVSVQIDESKLKKQIVGIQNHVSANTNSHLATAPEIVSIGKPHVCISGQDSFELPSKLEIMAIVAPAIIPEVVIAKEMQVKDQNPANFSTFKKMQGLKHNMILSLLADHHGNLWFGTGGGFTKYDGKFFSHFNIKKEITDENSSIFEDASNNIWLITTDGIVKYDGRTFVQFGTNGAIGPVDHVEVDKSGNIWISPISGGVHVLTPETSEPGGYLNSNNAAKDDSLKNLRYTFRHFGRDQGFTDKKVDQIYQDKSGHLWFLARDGGGLIKLVITEISNDKTRLSKEGISHDTNNKNLRYTFSHFKTQNLIFDYRSPRMFEDHNGNMWFSITGGICKYDGFTFSRIMDKESSEDPITTRLEDSDGNLWFSIGGKGALKYTPPMHGGEGSFTHFTTKEGLSNNSIKAIIEDKSGSIWIATDDGLNKYHGKVLTHLTEKDGLVYPRAMSILEDRKGDLWFGSFGYGVSNYDGQAFTYINKKAGLCGDFIWSMLEDTRGNLWLGSLDGGISKYTYSGTNHTGTITNFTAATGLGGSVYSICEDYSGNLWFGEFAFSTKLYRYTPQTNDHLAMLTSFSTPQGMSDTSVFSIKEDNNRNLWFGTNLGGVMRYTPPSADQHGIFTHFTTKEGFSNNRVWTITKDNNGHLWFGTDGDGLVYFDGKYFVDISEKEGLSNNYVLSSMLDHQGNLWFGTRFGLNMLPKNIVDTIEAKVNNGTLQERDVLFHTYTYEDGFQGIGCDLNSICEDRHGTIWLGANDRVTSYHPEGDIWDTIAPNIQLTRIDLFNEAIGWPVLDKHRDSSLILENGVKIQNAKFNGLSGWYGLPENLSLAHNNNYITFNFIGITMSHPGKVKYQYRLEGLDFNWSALTSDNYAQYGNLPYGGYTFRVKAMNSERYWSNEFKYPFTIRRPWWLTWWAYSTYVLVLSASLYAIFNLYKKRLILRNQLIMEQDEAIRLKELDTFKSQLFTNLTHEFRTPLTVILGMANQLTQGAWKTIVGEKEKNRVSQGLSMIENNGKNLLHLINQLLDLSKLENKSFKLQTIQGDIIPYLRYVTESFLSYAEDMDLKLNFSSVVDTQMMDFDPEQIKQILTNLISNAIKFTPPGGEINVQTLRATSHLKFTVSDTGIGISPKDLPHVLDRFYQADNSSTRVAQGTGIGLAHTQELLKIIGGDISIESELGKGTNVTILVPIRNEAPLLGQEEIAFPPKPHLSFMRPPGENISDNASMQVQEASLNEAIPKLLIIEDNRDVVDYLKSCLEPAYQILIAYNGKVGVDKAVEEIPDFIISDVMMPEMDGYQVCDKLKNDERTSHIPIILLTAKADAASRLTGLRRGADAYMAKPFSPEELSLQISTLLENRRRMAAYFLRALGSESSQQVIETSLPEAIMIEDAFIKKVNAIIEENYSEENFSLPQLCHEIGMSRSQLFRKIKAVADTSPSDMIRTYRLKKAKDLLESGDVSVAEATYQVGFKDPSYFSKLFQEEFGVAPSALSK